MATLVIGLTIIVLALVFLFGGKKLITLVKGFVGLFVEDLAKTPEGAEAVYTEAIDQTTDKYNMANNTLQKISGQLSTAKNKLEELNRQLKDCERNCETFAKNGDDTNLVLFAQKRDDILLDLESQQKMVEELTPLCEDAKTVNQHLEQKLMNLKKEKTRVVNNLRMNKQMKSMYDDMDELKNVKSVDKLLSSVKEGAQESREQAVGAREVHNNKLSTKISNAEVKARQMQNNSYIEELKKKYKK